MIKPIIYRMYDVEGLAIAKLINKENRTNFQARCLSGVLHLLDDGRAVEVSTDTRGCWLYGVYPTLDDALGYKVKQCDTIRLEQW